MLLKTCHSTEIFSRSSTEVFGTRSAPLAKTSASAEHYKGMFVAPLLTTDFWTSNNNESYCGKTGQWIDCDWKLTSVTLGCLHVEERHTAVNVASLYSQFADEWHISDKIRCIMTDNARNMVAAIGRTAYIVTCRVLHFVFR